MKKILALFVASLVIIPIFSLTLTMPVFAGSPRQNVGWGDGGNTDNSLSPKNLSDKAGLSLKDPREIVANVINVILGFLGIIAVVLILIGGFMWMTSQGSEEKTGTAKKIMSAGVIGLVIVLAAFGIAKFVVSALITATT